MHVILDAGEVADVAPGGLLVLGTLTCAFLVGPWTDRDTAQYEVAGKMIALGVVLWLMTRLWDGAVRANKTGFRQPDELSRRHPNAGSRRSSLRLVAVDGPVEWYPGHRRSRSHRGRRGFSRRRPAS